jgi:hypothetical protein
LAEPDSSIQDDNTGSLQQNQSVASLDYSLSKLNLFMVDRRNNLQKRKELVEVQEKYMASLLENHNKNTAVDYGLIDKIRGLNVGAPVKDNRVKSMKEKREDLITKL